ncbi:MAG: replicative DNA helicase [Rickettsiaceae bacterium]|nr:replicative DNA helicase [Rickettsiaceae bacterium]
MKNKQVIVPVEQFNIESEQLLLGSILSNNEIYNQVAEFLKYEHFYEPLHQKIYETVSTLIDKNMSATITSINAMLAKNQTYVEIGGREYLVRLMSGAIAVMNYYDHAKLIYDLAIKRSLIFLCEEIVKETNESNIDVNSSNLLEMAEIKLFSLATEGVANGGFEKASSSIKESLVSINRAMQSDSHLTGITSGYTDLDNKLFGFHDSDLIILAGRPSMGKTAFALNLAINSARFLHQKKKKQTENGVVGFFSLEMSSEQLSTRLLAMESNIDASSLRSGKINEASYNRLQEAASTLSDLPFFIDDTGMLSISALRTRARRLKRKHNLSILFVDYLQLITTNSKKENRVLEVSEITMSLKALAKELSIPIIVLSQLSRAVETRDDKRPMLSDLRESGAIEQDADIVMFIYREEYYLSRKEPEAGTDKHAIWLDKLNRVHNQAEILIAKHRNGPIGNIMLYYDSNHSKFNNLEVKHQ